MWEVGKGNGAGSVLVFCPSVNDGAISESRGQKSCVCRGSGTGTVVVAAVCGMFGVKCHYIFKGRCLVDIGCQGLNVCVPPKFLC